MKPDGTFQTVYSFCNLANCADGSAPATSLIQDSAGVFYGVTSQAPGTLFSYSPQKGLTTLHTFCTATSCADGEIPQGPLLQASDGNFYGVTMNGGSARRGTIFQWKPSGQFASIHSFCVSGFPCPDGSGPIGALVEGKDGNLYGLEGDGARSAAFQLTPNGAVTLVGDFCDPDQPSDPGCTWQGSEVAGRLFLAGDGNIYGTTEVGGNNGGGEIFSLAGAGESAFFGSLGSNPVGGVLEDGYGSLYGVDLSGGTGYGGLYALSFGPIVDGTEERMPGAIVVHAAEPNLLTGDGTDISWKVNNATSRTMQNCVGRLNGTVTANAPVAGTLRFTPPSAGTYQAAFTCGGIESGFVNLTVTDAPAATETSLFATLLGNTVLFLDGNVEKKGTPNAPGGSVQLNLNGQTIATVPLFSSGYNPHAGFEAQLPLGNLAPGSYSLQAIYPGDAGDAASTSAHVEATVNHTSTIGVFPPLEFLHSTGGQLVSVSLVYFVENLQSTTAPTGTVAFTADGLPVCKASLANGFAECSYQVGAHAPAPGTYTVLANYSGDANNAPLSTTRNSTIDSSDAKTKPRSFAAQQITRLSSRATGR